VALAGWFSKSAKRIGSRARSVKGCRTAPTENGTGHGDRVVAEHLIRTDDCLS
jgi:hypothetical protein